MSKEQIKEEFSSHSREYFENIFISRRALAREGDYEMHPVCECVRVRVR